MPAFAYLQPMSVNPPISFRSELLPPRTWTVKEYEAIIEAGVVSRDSKVELLQGIITEKMGTGSVHDYVVRQLLLLCIQRLGQQREVGSQSPVNVPPLSKPEPDVWVSSTGRGSHRDETISSADLALVMEVADSSIQRDRKVKLPIYAAAGIPEYWLLDVNTERLTIFTNPGTRNEEPSYLDEQIFSVEDQIDHRLLGEILLNSIFR